MLLKVWIAEEGASWHALPLHPYAGKHCATETWPAPALAEGQAYADEESGTGEELVLRAARLASLPGAACSRGASRSSP